MFKQIEPTSSFSTIVYENKEKIALMGALVVLYNWYRIRERSRRVDEKKRTSVVDVRPNQNINKRFKNSRGHTISPEIMYAKNCLLEQLISHETAINKIYKVPNIISDYGLREIETIVSPFLKKDEFSPEGSGFLPANCYVYQGFYVLNNSTYQGNEAVQNSKSWLAAGPRKHIFFNPKQVKAAIVTCGGLCPGLNVVIREIYLCLKFLYGVDQIWGIKYGYQGFYTHDWVRLTNDEVKSIHFLGGTIIGSSRGGFEKQKIIDAIQKKGINQIYVIGGDGTHKGIQQIYNQLRSRNYQATCVGIPKTIDNDIPIIDKSFGFETAVAESIRAIRSAYVESTGADYGIGLVRLMGRDAGWIAMEATNISRDVNICLIPQSQFDLHGEHGVLEYVYKQIKQLRHMVIVVAEGAGESVRDNVVKLEGTDKSGNVKLPDIGAFLKKEIVSYCKDKGIEVTLKYIDPTYMIRTVPAMPSDQIMCGHLASSAVHGAMAGFTGFTAGHVQSSVAMIPLSEISGKKNKVNLSNRSWQRVLGATDQPSFLNDLPPVIPEEDEDKNK